MFHTGYHTQFLTPHTDYQGINVDVLSNLQSLKPAIFSDPMRSTAPSILNNDSPCVKHSSCMSLVLYNRLKNHLSILVKSWIWSSNRCSHQSSLSLYHPDPAKLGWPSNKPFEWLLQTSDQWPWLLPRSTCCYPISYSIVETSSNLNVAFSTHSNPKTVRSTP